MQEDIELCLTKEIFNEINRQDDKKKREEARKFTQEFTILPTPSYEFERIRENLQGLFPQQMNESDKSDLNQLTHSIAANIRFFVTRDNPLRKKVAKQIYENFGMHIIRPADLIINRDALLREAEYQPAKLAGSRISSMRIQPGQSDFLENTFYSPQRETKAEFRQKLLPYIADPHTFQANIIQDAKTPLAFLVYGRQNERELEIPIIRIVKSPLSATLARYLIFSTIITASNEKRAITRITDSCLSNEVIDALQENGFVSINEGWAKTNLSIVTTSKELISELASLRKSFPTIDQYFQQIIDVLKIASIEGNMQTLLRVERALWPAKIMDIDIPAFIVPIRPVWAMQLFDQKISEQDLFGAIPDLIFRLENVYYRSSRKKVLGAPARILWYVSKGTGKYQGIMSIRACSYLDDVVVDKPKVLFSRFKRLGVYRWKDVFKLAKENIDQEIMAFQFSNTEILNHPIPLEELRKIWRDEIGKNFQALSPISISNQLYFHLYKMGFQTYESKGYSYVK